MSDPTLAQQPSTSTAVRAASTRQADRASGEIRSRYYVSPATLLFAAAIAGFAAMRLWRLTFSSLDGDEIFGLLLARGSWHELFAGVAKDAIHPPLFYILLKIWRSLGGESLFWLRLFPLVVTLLCIVPLFYLCRRLHISPMARNLAVGIVAVHPSAVFYGQDTRMYSLLMLAGLLSAWCFVRYMEEPWRGNLAWLTVVNLLLVYTQYYGWLIVGIEFAYLLRQRRPIRGFALSILVVAALFTPWAWIAGQVLHGRGLQQNLGWLPRPRLGEFTWFFSDLTGFAEFPNYWIATPLVLTFLAIVYRRGREPGMQWLVWLWILPPTLAFLVSQWLPQSIWGHRHLIFTLWPFAIVLADSVWRTGKITRAIAFVAIAVWVALAISIHPSDNRRLPGDTLTLALLDHEHHTGLHIPLYSVDPYLHYPIWFFLETLKNNQLGPFGPHLDSHQDVRKLAATAAEFDVIKSSNLEAAHDPYFWIGYFEPWTQGPTPRQILEQRGCQLGPEVTAHSRFQTAILIPVNCPPSGVHQR